MSHPRRGFLGLAMALALCGGAGPASALVWQTYSDGSVYRFFPDGVSTADYVPSPAFLFPCLPDTGRSDGPRRWRSPDPAQAGDECLRGSWTTGTGPCPGRTVPSFGDFNDHEIVTLPVAPGTSLYGLGEAGGPLLRNGTIVECWNSDIYGYAVGSSPLYQSHPWLLGVRADGTAFGLLVDTSARCTFDLTDGIRVTIDGPPAAVVTIERGEPLQVLWALADLTGHMPMPPRWALGYHQCRWSYTPDTRVREVAAEFRRRHIPCDVLWLDIDYMDGFRCFTFNPTTFPDPAALNADLHAQGFHSVWMIDCGIKKDPGYSVYDSGTAGNHWVQDAAGQPVVGSVWPGPCVFPDFTRAETRAWWAGLYKDFLGKGVDGVWNDMNEPSVFDSPNKTLPLDARHRADADLGGPGNHARYHNVYGMQMARATRQGFLAAGRAEPFVLTRAGFLGSQRYAATWTGDNTADWPHLAESVPMVLSLGLSGQPFAGPDIGGFKDRGDGALFARWMGLGAFLPFARGHTARQNGDKEPWSFGPEVEATCRLALEARYRLLPYLESVFSRAHRTGVPVVRPLFFAEPANAALRAEDQAFLLGDDLLVVPQVAETARHTPPALQGLWRELTPRPGWSERAATGELPRLFVRPGRIVPLAPVKEWVGQEKPADVEFVIALDKHGMAMNDFTSRDCHDGRTGLLVSACRNGSVVEVAIEGEDDCPAWAGAHFTVLTAPGESPPKRIVRMDRKRMSR